MKANKIPARSVRSWLTGMAFGVVLPLAVTAAPPPLPPPLPGGAQPGGAQPIVPPPVLPLPE
ncbi:MAG: hypothetical protein ACRDHZ_13590, partial [Ktedonobacteraceae bacterium]